MKAELQNALREKYPDILCEMGGDPKETCMAWGIECDDGWFDLLDKTFAKIQYVCRLTESSPSPVGFVASQVKEKFGSLSLYYRLTGEKIGNEMAASIIADLVASGERKSSSTCEVGGEHGVMCHRSGWLKTLCRAHALESGYEARDAKIQEFWLSKGETGSDKK
jgi:hypothetical protein